MAAAWNKPTTILIVVKWVEHLRVHLVTGQTITIFVLLFPRKKKEK